jgi:hypothetical protein
MSPTAGQAAAGPCCSTMAGSIGVVITSNPAADGFTRQWSEREFRSHPSGDTCSCQESYPDYFVDHAVLTNPLV